MRAAFVICALVGTAACSHDSAPTAVPALPALARTTLALSTPMQGNVWVPRLAVVERSGIPGVFVLEQGRARFRMVRLGRRDGGRVEVLSGLTGAEVLVTGDLTAVRDGSPIAVGV